MPGRLYCAVNGCQDEMKLRVLFVSDTDSIRGQMAEGFLRSLAGEGVTVESAGVGSEAPNPLAVKVMAEAGIDISAQVSKSVPELRPRAFDLVVTLGESARAYCAAGDPKEPETEGGPGRKTPVLQGAPLLLHWQVPAPGAGGGKALDAFRATRDRIRDLVRSLLEQGVLAAVTNGRRHLEDILDLLEDGVAAHDGKQRRIYLFNRAAERITGYKREDVIGRDCHDVFPPDGICGSYCAFKDDGKGGAANREHTVPFVTQDGTVKRLRIVAAITDTESRRPDHVVLTMRDVTEISDLRARLKDRYGFQNMVGVSRAMQEVFTSIRQVSALDYPVLISGESGTGKELVARAIHELSRRGKAPFVPINCGALPDHILESELFGHVRGAFTGATSTRKGRFQLADGGTLFLDEVEELSPAFQVKLLRVLQDMRFEPVGGERTVTVDVRVLSATNRDLKQKVDKGEFREDLYYRLCVVPLDLPPLRKRRDDIPFLVERYLAEVGKETGRGINAVSDEAMQALLAYGWPGNVRELINALRFAAVRCAEHEIELSCLPVEVRQAVGDGSAPVAPERRGGDDDPGKESRRGKKEKLTPSAVRQALDQAGGNRVHAAKLLGVSRATLYRFLDRNLLS